MDGLVIPIDGSEILSRGSVNDPIAFSWGKVDLSKKYRFQISSDKSFSSVVLDETIEKNQYFLTKPLPRGRMFWRVRAESNRKNSVWTPTFYFDTQ